MGKTSGTHEINKFRKSEGSTLIARPDRRWKSNNKMDLKGIGCEGMDWIDLSQEETSEWLL
jgi:hypothetical protein